MPASPRSPDSYFGSLVLIPYRPTVHKGAVKTVSSEWNMRTSRNESTSVSCDYLCKLYMLIRRVQFLIRTNTMAQQVRPSLGQLFRRKFILSFVAAEIPVTTRKSCLKGDSSTRGPLLKDPKTVSGDPSIVAINTASALQFYHNLRLPRG